MLSIFYQLHHLTDIDAEIYCWQKIIDNTNMVIHAVMCIITKFQITVTTHIHTHTSITEQLRGNTEKASLVCLTVFFIILHCRVL